MSNAQYYYYKNRGQTLGPFDLGQIQQRAKRAQVSNRSEISVDGFSWQPAQNFPEIFAGSTAAPPSAAMSSAAPAVAVVEEAAEWYYMLNGEQQGPVTEGQLQQMIGLGNVKDTDHVWKDGMIDWLEIRYVPDLAVQQANTPQPMTQQPMMPQYPAAVGLSWYQWLPNAIKTKYADFSGRARRKEFWFFQLHYMLMLYAGLFALLFFEGLLTEWEGFGEAGIIVLAPGYFLVYTLILFVPFLAVNVRRLHDVDKSGWWLLIHFVPFGPLVLLVFFCQDGDSGPNRYGPNPKV